MLARLLKLLFPEKAQAIGDQADAIRDTLREANERLRAELQLDNPAPVNGRSRRAIASPS